MCKADSGPGPVDSFLPLGLEATDDWPVRRASACGKVCKEGEHECHSGEQKSIRFMKKHRCHKKLLTEEIIR